MHVVIYTHAFPPMIGGIETITMELAQRLTATVQSASPDAVRVTVVTPREEGATNEQELPFRIVRRPSLPQLVRLVRQADVLHLAGPLMLPLFLGWMFRKRMVV